MNDEGGACRGCLTSDNIEAGPTVIFLCDPITGEPGAALLIGESLAREPGETEAAFVTRATDREAALSSMCGRSHNVHANAHTLI